MYILILNDMLIIVSYQCTMKYPAYFPSVTPSKKSLTHIPGLELITYSMLHCQPMVQLNTKIFSFYENI